MSVFLQGAYGRNQKVRNRNTNAYIDESLFGGDQSTGRGGGNNPRRRRSAGRRATRGRRPRSRASQGGGGPTQHQDAVVISRAEMEYMHNSSLILSEAEMLRQTQAMNQNKAALADRGRHRKEKMLAMEMERKKRTADLTETEKQTQDQRHLLLSHAKQAMDEELDDVKHMNQMMLYAKCVTIRDAQIREKQKLATESAAEERRLDMQMEVERIKNLKMYEERERVRKEEQKQGASIIIKQIQEREAERIRQQELREQEAQAMLQRIRELEIREEEERDQKTVAGRKLLEQVVGANNAQARAKLRKKQEEIKEDLRIAEYIRQKEAREAQLEAGKERKQAESERETARLRAMQEKAADQQAEIDELRAKRYQEAKNRAWRQTQMAIAKKKSGMKSSIADARDQQRLEKAQRMAEQALQEREEYQRVLEWQKTQNDIDAAREREGRSQKEKHRETLLSQIQQHEREKAVARQMFLEEGKKISSQMEGDKRKLLRLKREKLELLKKAGIPEKYRAELKKKKVMVSTIH